MKQNKKNWRQSVSISKLPVMLLFGILLATSTFSNAQSNPNQVLPLARMQHTNVVTVRSGLHPTYKIHVGHMDFSSVQEATAYFQEREVDYINFVVVDENTVMMHFDLTNPAVSNWTLADWQQALEVRAVNSVPRALPTN